MREMMNEIVKVNEKDDVYDNSKIWHENCQVMRAYNDNFRHVILYLYFISKLSFESLMFVKLTLAAARSCKFSLII